MSTCGSFAGSQCLLFLLGNWCPGKTGWFKFAKISPSSGFTEILQSSAPSGKNNGATAGAALPCSETPVAPHCLQGKVQMPSLEFERRHDRARPAYRALSLAATSCPARPSSSPPEPQNPHLPGTQACPVPQPTVSLLLATLLKLTLFPGSAGPSTHPGLHGPPTNKHLPLFLYFHI